MLPSLTPPLPLTSLVPGDGVPKLPSGFVGQLRGISASTSFDGPLTKYVDNVLSIDGQARADTIELYA